ncbi:hypothetical protein C0J29_31745 (plasmid) [Mycobacterium paragordonae]|uniref:Sensor domain-containing protein n=1 Tax=Mycobacterium paragordonae TaxID=1389713 RepID=A0ABQ1CFK8_9MYCO|nr:hypothetical protein [Mycobacterium paragordonae]AYE99540.1 hypothetical protein C0J29_31745 [Mycobacterium paragordonae]GFG83246.1 hypothetical protein MPRG_65220 [Mycobacterium paragordonae]
MKALLSAGVAASLAALVLIVVVMVAPATATMTHTGQRICAAMLGQPPEATATVATLQDAQTQALAPAGLTGQDAYQFVATLNTVINWRDLPAAQVSAWAANPAATPLPEGAQIDTPWPVPRSNDPAPAFPQSVSLYESACATVLHRVDVHVANPPHSATPITHTTPPDTASSQQPPIVAEVIKQLGTRISPEVLWQWTSPTPHLDAKRTLFEQLTRTAPQAAPRPGDLTCYDYTVNGPARCALVLSLAPTPLMAATTADGILAAAPIPANSTIIGPEPAEVAP